MPALAGADAVELEFAVLPEGEVVGDVSSAAVPALTRDLGLEPPYRVVARRRGGDGWAVGAVTIQVAELPADTEGEELMLTVNEQGERELYVDREQADAGADALMEHAGTPQHGFVLRARRLRGTLWETSIDRL